MKGSGKVKWGRNKAKVPEKEILKFSNRLGGKKTDALDGFLVADAIPYWNTGKYHPRKNRQILK